MTIRRGDDAALFDAVEERNLLRQYDLLSDCIRIGLSKGIDSFDHAMLWCLNSAAVANVTQFGGRYREQPIYVGTHVPPHFRDVPRLMEQFIATVRENWDDAKDPLVLPAYALWRMNWIHPFVEGNGRTARVVCYLLICLQEGTALPGQKILPERIRENRREYYDALRAADRRWAEGHFDVSDLVSYLARLLEQQLGDT